MRMHKLELAITTESMMDMHFLSNFIKNHVSRYKSRKGFDKVAYAEVQFLEPRESLVPINIWLYEEEEQDIIAN